MIYHITSQGEWAQYQITGKIEPESLRTEGFVHCSTKDQVVQVASFYFTGRRDLMLLEINEAALLSDLRWEGSGEGPKIFPHVYAAIPINCVAREVNWQASDRGEFEFPFTIVLH